MRNILKDLVRDNRLQLFCLFVFCLFSFDFRSEYLLWKSFLKKHLNRKLAYINLEISCLSSRLVELSYSMHLSKTKKNPKNETRKKKKEKKRKPPHKIPRSKRQSKKKKTHVFYLIITLCTEQKEIIGFRISI